MLQQKNDVKISKYRARLFLFYTIITVIVFINYLMAVQKSRRTKSLCKKRRSKIALTFLKIKKINFFFKNFF